jgi:hypothetical protein
MGRFTELLRSRNNLGLLAAVCMNLGWGYGRALPYTTPWLRNQA